MIQIRVSEDIRECRNLWESIHPAECLFDSWEVRSAFHEVFDRRPFFIVAENSWGKVEGLLPLCWIEDIDCFGAFPGETWQGKTWLEQNKIVARNAETLRAMLDVAPAPVHLRYCSGEFLPSGYAGASEDEVGYLFHPARYGYSFDNYMQEFSSKSRKQIRRERERFEEHGVSWRYNCLGDVGLMFRMNQQAFREDSYFSDPRFLAAFENLVSRLQAFGCLRVTTALVGGRVAAVDIGAVWDGEYVVLGGGVCPEFTGIAKVINFHHLEWACAQRLDRVDFLCGDFGWKERFHLASRPLMEIRSVGAGCREMFMPLEARASA